MDIVFRTVPITVIEVPETPGMRQPAALADRAAKQQAGTTV
jgi:hypothetical protein